MLDHVMSLRTRSMRRGKIKMNRVPTTRKAVDGRDDISKLLIKDDLQEKKDALFALRVYEMYRYLYLYVREQ